MRDICPDCEKVTDLRLICREEQIQIHDESIVVPVEYLKCLECGALFDDPKMEGGPVGRAYAIYCKRHPREPKCLEYEFRITLAGRGDTVDEAWLDAIESFTSDPGSTPDDAEQRRGDGGIQCQVSQKPDAQSS